MSVSQSGVYEWGGFPCQPLATHQCLSSFGILGPSLLHDDDDDVDDDDDDDDVGDYDEDEGEDDDKPPVSFLIWDQTTQFFPASG